MLIQRVIPCLLLSGGGLVKTTKFRDEVYVGDPINAVRIFNDHEVDELVVLDIHASAKGAGPNYQAIRNIADECFMPLAYGGGISTLDQVKLVFELGVEKVILNSTAIANPDLVTEILEHFGSQSIIISIDIEKSLFGNWRVRNKYNPTASTGKPLQFALDMERAGAGEILLNDCSRDGMMSGLNLPLITEISAKLSIPIIAIGGVGCLQDIRDGFLAGASAVSAGAFCVFKGKHRAVLISYPTRKDITNLLEDL